MPRKRIISKRKNNEPESPMKRLLVKNAINKYLSGVYNEELFRKMCRRMGIDAEYWISRNNTNNGNVIRFFSK